MKNATKLTFSIPYQLSPACLTRFLNDYYFCLGFVSILPEHFPPGVVLSCFIHSGYTITPPILKGTTQQRRKPGKMTASHRSRPLSSGDPCEICPRCPKRSTRSCSRVQSCASGFLSDASGQSTESRLSAEQYYHRWPLSWCRQG